MATINKTAPKPARADFAHTNFMGGPSWDLSDPVNTLRMAAASCFFGEPMYYHTGDDKPRKTPYTKGSSLSDRDLTHLRRVLDARDPVEWRGLSPAELIESAIDKALDSDPRRTLEVAVALRNEDNIRVTPQVILVRAAHHPAVRGTRLVSEFAPQIIKRADEPATGMAYQISKYGRRPIPNSLKRAWRKALEGLSDYHVAKYAQGSRIVKMVDVVNLVRPASTAVDKLVRGEASNTGNTWEAIISAEGSNTAGWTKALDVLGDPRGHMALLRNLNNLIKNGVDPDLWVQKLIDGVPDGKQLPFRYVSAYNAVKATTNDPRVLDAIETCLERSYENAPHFPGRVMSLCDNSGSAWGALTSSMGTMPIATIANLTGIITGSLADEGHVGVFGDRLETFPVRRKASVFDQLEKLNSRMNSIGGGTEHGIWLFWDKAIRESQHWDHVFVYSDMQAGHGGLYGTGGYPNYVWGGKGSYERYIDVPKLISEYRSKVNPNVFVYLVQVAGYKDTIVPEVYNKTFILGGWSNGILNYAASMAGLNVPHQ